MILYNDSDLMIESIKGDKILDNLYEYKVTVKKTGKMKIVDIRKTNADYNVLDLYLKAKYIVPGFIMQYLMYNKY